MNNILFILGPTATGKTSFAIELAKKFDGELISADSRQVYRSLDIITGKDHGDFPIHLIDIVDPDQPFSVSQWHDLALQKIQEIQSKNKSPIIVGGTGLYVKSLLNNLDTISIPPNPELRNKLSKLSVVDLFNKLNNEFPAVASSLNASDSKNPRRLVRKFEIAEHYKNFGNKPLLAKEGVGGDFRIIGLTCPTNILDSRIDQRVEERIELGAAQEAKQILARYPHDLPSLSACGYLSFLQPDPVAAWKIAEHQYARRQLTWFKKQSGITWFDITKPDWKQCALKLIIDSRSESPL